jgi:hypothetical protein
VLKVDVECLGRVAEFWTLASLFDHLTEFIRRRRVKNNRYFSNVMKLVQAHEGRSDAGRQACTRFRQ